MNELDVEQIDLEFDPQINQVLVHYHLLGEAHAVFSNHGAGPIKYGTREWAVINSNMVKEMERIETELHATAKLMVKELFPNEQE